MASNIRVFLVIIVCVITLLLPKNPAKRLDSSTFHVSYPNNLTVSCDHID